jgi:hypothetical protein
MYFATKILRVAAAILALGCVLKIASISSPQVIDTHHFDAAVATDACWGMPLERRSECMQRSLP